MKKIVSICLVCLLSLTAVAQVKKTRRLRAEVLPKEMVTTTVSFSYYIGGTSYGYSCQSDTMDVIVELVSKHSGQVQRRLMNGLNLYEFRYLPENTNYSLVLRNSRGIEVAMIDNVFMEKEDKTVTFDRLKDIHNLSLTLMDGTTMADQSLYHTTWLYASGSYLARGLSLPNMVEGEKLCCVVDFDRDMAMKYQLPDTVTVVVGQDADDIVLPLKPLRDTLVTFTVVDSLTNQGIDKTTIQLTQLLPSSSTRMATW